MSGNTQGDKIEAIPARKDSRNPVSIFIPQKIFQ
jgi:hypothetical protein